MPSYTYRAISGPGKSVERTIEADSEESVVIRLEAMGLTPVWVRPASQVKGRQRQGARRGGRVRGEDVTVFTRQLASMTRAGVPVLRALKSIEEQTESTGMQQVVEDLAGSIRDGGMLSEGLRRFPKYFPDLYVNMVEAGEAAGKLDVMLFRLAESRELEAESRRSVQAAMAYPMLVLGVGLVTVMILLLFFMPRVMALFTNVNELPMPTRILLGVSDFLSTQWYWFLIGAGMLVAVIHRLAAMEKGRLFFDRLLLRTPLVGRFLWHVDLARFSRTFALLIDAGLAIDQVLRLSGKTIHNTLLQQELDEVRRQTVQQGDPLSQGLKQSEWFPAYLGNMVAVGEETGRLEEAMGEASHYFQSDLDRRSRIAKALLEPVLLLVVGCVVGFIVFAMLMPIFEMGSQLR